MFSTSLSHLVTFSRLIEHFHMAPVAAASNSLFSTLNDKDTRGSRPPNFRTSSRVSLSSAHWKQVKKKKNQVTSSRLSSLNTVTAAQVFV